MTRIVLVLLSVGIFPAMAGIDFSRDVLPILSDACFNCHGPDEKGRKADLRLDTKEGAFRTVDGITVVAPGDLEKSELALRISSTDRDEMMPPPDAKRTLTEAERTTLRQWVAEGAPWGQHWAFTPVASTAGSDRKLREVIDEGVAVRLAQEGLEASPAASPERLLRRVTLDLTGLPPAPAELDAFLQAPSDAAYEQAVDRLLASPRFGERLATEWLDVARFADTHGYQMDRPRAMWPWRDWVIQAFNENLPYDQFITWQVAGDLLPNPTKDQRLATAFNRLHCQNEEGGIVEEEYRVAYVVDRVNTFGTAFLGLTLDCARCHDHRYDPITQRDYYALFSFFQNIDEAGQTTYFTNAMPVPTLLLSSDAQDQELEKLRAGIASADQACTTAEREAEPAFTEWLKARAPDAIPALPQPAGHYDFAAREGATVPNRANPELPARVVENPALESEGEISGAVLDGENGFTFPGVGHFSRSDSFTLALHLRAPAAPAERAVVLHHSKAPVDAGSRGYELLLENGRVAVGLHHMWPGNALKVRTNHRLKPGQWARVAVTYDGSSRARGVRIYIDGKECSVEVIRDHLVKDITYGGGEPDLAIGHRFRDSGFKGGAVARLRVFSTALTDLEIQAIAGQEELQRLHALPVASLSQQERAGLFEYFLARVDPASKAAHENLARARDALRRYVEPIPEAMVMQELPTPKPAFILQRGAYDSHGPEVTADTPGAFLPFPADAPRNRLGLARWLLDPANPLTARVAVNRFWQMMFGRGLVETSDNFGLQGTSPTHPAILDALAAGFIQDGWNVKAVLKEIALSRTYRQASTAPPELLARDPENLLLARGPARRLSAEMLRDQALAIGGLLTEKIGGPSVKPYQPAGLWEEIAMGKPKYEQSRGADLYRRSLYTFWKRTVPPPAMVTFDAAERSLCSVRRQTTSTPLQALALLNDVQIVEAARAAAERILKAPAAGDSERVRALFRSITSRWPSAAETDVLNRLLAEQRQLFEADEATARQLLANGESPPDPALPPAQLAAATVLAQAILNHDEAVMRR